LLAAVARAAEDVAAYLVWAGKLPSPEVNQAGQRTGNDA
jgi:hypothetical protein